jgi:hypothetical protein
MNTRRALIFMAAAFAASCINYTGLEGDGAAYKEPIEVLSGGEFTCSSAAPDDGATVASSLGPASLDCAVGYQLDWSGALKVCEALGHGYRLASKAVALRIAQSSDVCRAAPVGAWYAWTSTCAGPAKAWRVDSDGATLRDDLGLRNNALCVR